MEKGMFPVINLVISTRLLRNHYPRARKSEIRNDIIIRESVLTPELEYLITRQVQLAIIVLKWNALGINA